MITATNQVNATLANLFPYQIKVFAISSKIVVENNPVSLLHKHFRKPLSEEALKKLAAEIADYLKDQEEHAVYSFFHRTAQTEPAQAEWFLSSARLNRSDKGLPGEVVIFSYELELIEDKKRLYQVLENDGFFKENFNKASSLTKREKEIAGLLANGMSSGEIAATKNISVHTVQTHRKRINEKLAIYNLAGLLKFAEVFDFTATTEHTL